MNIHTEVLIACKLLAYFRDHTDDCVNEYINTISPVLEMVPQISLTALSKMKNSNKELANKLYSAKLKLIDNATTTKMYCAIHKIVYPEIENISIPKKYIIHPSKECEYCKSTYQVIKTENTNHCFDCMIKNSSALQSKIDVLNESIDQLKIDLKDLERCFTSLACRLESNAEDSDRC